MQPRVPLPWRHAEICNMHVQVEGALGGLLTSASLLELPDCCNGVPTMHGKLCGTVSPAKPHFTYCNNRGFQ